MKVDGVNIELFFVSEVLKLKSLHYGYWDEPPAVPGAVLGLSEISRAQERYTLNLLQAIPHHVKSVLDVGCGIGDNARAMLGRGLRVTALSPDKSHRRYFDDLPAQNLSFYGSKFEDLNIDQVFDLVLMSESQNYFDADIGLKQARRYLRPGGYLLIAGLFRKQHDAAFGKIRNVTGDYLEKAARTGFALVQTRDITTHVLPTIQTINAVRLQHLEPALDLVQRYLRASMPLKLKVMQLLFRKQMKELAKLATYYKERTDPAVFVTHVEYLIFLFQLRPAAVE
jgi:SAM-dependent methyltransferase